MAKLYDLYDPSLFPWWAIHFFFITWLFSVFAEACMKRMLGGSFSSLDKGKQRNVVTYIVAFFGTTVALVAQITGGWSVLFKGDDSPSLEMIEWMTLSISTIAVLYVWELIYRSEIGLPLLIHHLVTLMLVQLVVASFADTGDILYLRFALLLGLHATTEQTTFVALACYRLRLFSKYHKALFFLSAGQSLLIKTAVTVVSLLFYAQQYGGSQILDSRWDVFWQYAFVPMLLVLYASQVYACYILFVIGNRRLERKVSKRPNIPPSDQEVETTENASLESGRESCDLDFDDVESLQC